MIIESITAHNFLSHADTTIDLTDASLWLVYGVNGSGKSALFDAVEFALYGEHRGGSQGTNLLVKGGERRATVQVVVALDGARYRVTQHIDARDGNLGGGLERWEPDAGAWRPLNVGTGVRAVWTWLADHLPSHGLFKSAIFLKQGNAGFFLSGNSADRMRRFADLVDLSRYTDLSRRAQARSERARETRQGAEAALAALGDVSDDALHAVEEEARRAAEGHAQAVVHATAAAAATQGARRWQDLLSRRGILEGQRRECEGLLADEAAIRADARRVAAWDAAEADVERHWRERDRAERQRSDAEAARAEVDRIAAELRGLAGEQEDAVARKAALDDEFPQARRRVDDAETFVRALTLEANIAKARDVAAAAEHDVERLSEHDYRLDEWRGRSAAMPLLEAVVGAEREFAAVTAEVEEATAGATAAEEAAATAAAVAQRVAVEHEKAEEAVAVGGDTVGRLREEVAGLKGQIESHGRLAGVEEQCPVCLQTLDQDAHARVREAFAGKAAALATKQAELVIAEKEYKDARQGCAAAENAKRQADGEAQSAVTASVRAHERVDAVTSRRERAMSARTTTRQTVAGEYPAYAAHLDEVTPAWLKAEKKRVEEGLKEAEGHARAVKQAGEAHLRAVARLDALRGQRAECADAAGDTAPAEDLAQRRDAAIVALDAREAEVGSLEEERGELDRRLSTVAQQIGELTGDKATAVAVQAAAWGDAKAASAEAGALAARLGERWPEALADRDGFACVRKDIDGRREHAALAPEVDKARGRLDHILTDLGEVARAADAIPEGHRISVEEAVEREREAHGREQAAAVVEGQATAALTAQREARRQAEERQRESAAAAGEADTYAELADLLKDNGPLQAEVAGREQQRIAAEANAVLAQLGDTLRIGIGGAQRASKAGIKNLHILDESDPAGRPRYFAYLSGGEQFRVATALALALHRRVGHGAGTIIIDEGFGSLDSDRRDAFAMQLTDTSAGILRLGLARSIVICSHAGEVQRHFDDRWLVVKDGGTATVCRFSPDKPGDDAD